MAKKSFDRLSYADCFPLAKKFFKQNTKWHPLTGGLPFNFLSQQPDALDMRCTELIVRARSLWRANERDSDISMARTLFDSVPGIILGKIGRLGPDQIPESALVGKARRKIGPVDVYKVLSIISIYFAWNTLKKIFLDKQPVNDSDLLAQTLLSQTFFGRAERYWLFEVQRKKEISERGRSGGTRDKKKQGIVLAVEWARRNSKQKTAGELWNYFKTKNFEEGEYEVYFYKDPTGAGEDRLCQKIDGMEAGSIKYEAFKKTYVYNKKVVK